MRPGDHTDLFSLPHMISIILSIHDRPDMPMDSLSGYDDQIDLLRTAGLISEHPTERTVRLSAKGESVALHLLSIEDLMLRGRGRSHSSETRDRSSVRRTSRPSRTR